MIIGISGKSKSGKDTVADFFVKEHRATKIALADPMKRFCKEVFAFTDEQLWGPSEMRNGIDERYPRLKGGLSWLCGSCCRELLGDPFEEKPVGNLLATAHCEGDFSPGPASSHGRDLHLVHLPTYFLTPRHALQQLGTQWGRRCYENVWVDYAIRMAKKLMERVTIGMDLEQHGSYQESAHWVYTPERGVSDVASGPPVAVVISDVRFKNEMEAIKAAGGKLIRVRRPEAGLSGEAGQHASETEQDDIEDALFDFVIQNDADLADLYLKAQHVFQALRSEEKEEENTQSFEQMLTKIDEMVEDGKEISLVSEDNITLTELLQRRALDVESGRIMEYDPAQADVPPFKRKKK